VKTSQGRGAQKARVFDAIRRSGLGCRETPGPPVVPHGAQTPWGVHAVKAATASRERARYGYTQIVQVADVGRTHRASCPLRGRKASWRARALARRKLEAPPDAGHESREGETVRGRALTRKLEALVRLVGLGSQARDTTEGVLGLLPALP
jgi:hypothetical protein